MGKKESETAVHRKSKEDESEDERTCARLVTPSSDD